jgi:hypothetical protein
MKNKKKLLKVLWVYDDGSSTEVSGDGAEVWEKWLSSCISFCQIHNVNKCPREEIGFIHKDNNGEVI